MTMGGAGAGEGRQTTRIRACLQRVASATWSCSGVRRSWRALAGLQRHARRAADEGVEQARAWTDDLSCSVARLAAHGQSRRQTQRPQVTSRATSRATSHTASAAAVWRFPDQPSEFQNQVQQSRHNPCRNRRDRIARRAGGRAAGRACAAIRQPHRGGRRSPRRDPWPAAHAFGPDRRRIIPHTRHLVPTCCARDTRHSEPLSDRCLHSLRCACSRAMMVNAWRLARPRLLAGLPLLAPARPANPPARVRRLRRPRIVHSCGVTHCRTATRQATRGVSPTRLDGLRKAVLCDKV